MAKKKLEPIAFLSYVREDDSHEDGRLSDFREQLGGELKFQTGDKFAIFQDRNDIGWGENWQRRIDDSIDAATFLIPVITPRYFKSRACRNELERFLAREKKLKRDDLILPVYYMNCPLLHDEKACKADKIACAVVAHNWTDWREYRFEPLTSPQIRKLIADMAGNIIKALERDGAATARKSSSPRTAKAKAPGGRTRPKASEANVIAEAATAANAATKAGPASKTEPKTIVVDAKGQGDHTTLTEALKAAESGERILVRPGIYKEGIIIDKAVEIVGDGDVADIVVEATGTNTVLFKATMGRIANLTLRQAGGGEWYCVDIGQGRLELEGCDVVSSGSSCILIRQGADPRLLGNRVHNSIGAGVLIFANGRGVFEDNDIFSCGGTGVGVFENSSPTFRRNRIRNGAKSGMIFAAGSSGVVEDNDICDNALVGVQISEDSNPVLRRNRINSGDGPGVAIYEGGKGVLEENEIFENELAGVAIRENSSPILRRNRIHHGKQAGVLVLDNGRGTLDENDVCDNAHAGVEIRDGGNLTMRGNRINRNESVGVWIYGDSKGTFEDNDLRDNKLGAWSVDKDCLPHVKRSGNIEK